MPPQYKSILENELRRGGQIGVGWPWRLLTFMIIIFGMMVLTYLGMTVGYSSYLDNRIAALDSKIKDLSAQTDNSSVQNVVRVYSQLANIKSILAAHPMPTNFSDLLSQNTRTGVHYTSLELRTEEKTAKLEGVATDYQVLAEQLEIFRRLPQITSVFMDNASQSKQTGGASFTIRLALKDTIFK